LPVDPNTSRRTRRSKAATAVLLAVLAVVTRLAITALPASAAGGTYTVTSTADNADTNQGGTADGICKAASTPVSCTLRAALFEANHDAGPSTITFNIPGTGVQTIASKSSRGDLPYLDEGGTTINGYSQPGAAPNTDPLVSNAVIKIQLQHPGPSGQSLLIRSSGNTVRGLAIFGGTQDVRIAKADGATADATDNVVAGNFLGTNAAGTSSDPVRDNATKFGVVIRSASKRNVVGGPNPADRNVISGHGGRGVLIGVPGTELDPGTDDNVVQNNLIGLNPAGTTALPNLGHAVDVNNGAAGNRIEGNVVSGNGSFSEGIEVSHGVSTRGNEVIDNKVGTNPAGTAGPAYARNGSNGIRVEDGADQTVVQGNVVGNNGGGGIQLDSLTHSVTNTRVADNFVGVTPGGTAVPNGDFGIRIGLGEGASPNPAASTDALIIGNEIAFNSVGIEVEGSGSLRNRITDNSIHDNTGLGIDLVPLNQVNQNDAGDGDTGPNTLLNWPVLTGATNLTASGTACGGCTVEVFQADSAATLDGASQTSYGEGKTLLATTTAAGDGSFVATLPPSVNARILTATATDAAGNTSEFGRNLSTPGSNGLPQPAFTATCPGLACTFDAGPTTDPDGDAITSYSWAFGDGGTGTGATPSHTYASAGTYRVTLTVQDSKGGSGSTTASLFVSSDTRLARDGFSRTVASGWGTADTGGAWTGTGGSTGLSVGGGAGRADVSPGGNREVVLAGVSTSQTDASVSVSTTRAPVGGDHVAAIVARRQNATVAYRGRLRIAADGTVWAGAEAGATLLGEQQVAGLTASPGTVLRLRVRVTGVNPTTIEVKVWRADQAEPGAFTFTTTDSTAGLQQAGTVGIRVSSSESLGGTVRFSVDDLDVVGPASSSK
jgi:CSLREA domain-containing protein